MSNKTEANEPNGLLGTAASAATVTSTASCLPNE